MQGFSLLLSVPSARCVLVDRLQLMLLALLLSWLTTAQSAPVPAAYPTVTAAEITSFMQSFEQDPNMMLAISTNPKRVPLLLGAIKRDPHGPWTQFLQGFCYQTDRVASWNLAPADKVAAYARPIQYLSIAEATIAKALETDPQNTRLKNNLLLLQKSIAQALTESGSPTNQGRSVLARTDTNQVLRVFPSKATSATADSSRGQTCSSQLKQIEISKKMWQVDHNKTADATPVSTDIASYFPFRQFPKCPNGGTYTIGKISQEPRCSIPGHTLANYPK